MESSLRFLKDSIKSTLEGFTGDETRSTFPELMISAAETVGRRDKTVFDYCIRPWRLFREPI